MTSPMYKNGASMQVTDNPEGRAVLIKAGWTEKEETKQEKLSMPKAKDDNSK